MKFGYLYLLLTPFVNLNCALSIDEIVEDVISRRPSTKAWNESEYILYRSHLINTYKPWRVDSIVESEDPQDQSAKWQLGELTFSHFDEVAYHEFSRQLEAFDPLKSRFREHGLFYLDIANATIFGE